MTFEMSEEVQRLKVYNFLPHTHEFIGESDAYIPPHTGLPANCTHIPPPEVTAAFVAVFDDKENAWSQIEDHRGKAVFDTGTGMQIYISELGPLPVNTTSLAPDGLYQKWNGDEWVKDEEAEKAANLRETENRKASLLREAGDKIAILQDAVDLEMATDEDRTQLTAWKKYRVLLSRADTALVSADELPAQPSE